MGKSDPYVRVLLSGIEKARTVTFLNNLNPEFEEVVYIPVHSPREKLTLEVMDMERVGGDRSLGLIEVAASDFIKEDESGRHPAHEEKTITAQPLRLGGKGSPKGTLTYTCAFYPTFDVVDPDDDDNNEVEEAGKSATATTNGNPSKTRDTRSGTVTSAIDIPKRLLEGEKDQEEARDVKPVAMPKIKLAAETLQNYGKNSVSHSFPRTDHHRNRLACLQNYRS